MSSAGSSEAAAKLAKAVAANKLKIDDNKLALPLCQLAKWRNISLPGKVFFVMFLVMFVVEIIAEMYYYYSNMNTFTANKANATFWVHYIMSANTAVIGFCFYMVLIHVLFYSGYRVMAWVMLFVPVVYYLATMINSRFVASLLYVVEGGSTKAWMTNMFNAVVAKAM